MCHSCSGFESEDGIQKVHLWLQEGQNVMALSQCRQAGAHWKEEGAVKGKPEEYDGTV